MEKSKKRSVSDPVALFVRRLFFQIFIFMGSALPTFRRPGVFDRHPNQVKRSPKIPPDPQPDAQAKYLTLDRSIQAPPTPTMDEKGRALQGRLDFCERNVKALQNGVKGLIKNHHGPSLVDRSTPNLSKSD